MSVDYPFNIRSKGQRSRSQSAKNILKAIEWPAWVCTLSSGYQFSFMLHIFYSRVIILTFVFFVFTFISTILTLWSFTSMGIYPPASWSKFPLPLPPFPSPFLPSLYHLTYPLSISLSLSLPISLPFSFPFPFPQIQLGGLGSALSWVWAENWIWCILTFNWKFWHLVRIILVTFMKNYIDFPGLWQNTSPKKFLDICSNVYTV